MFVAKDINGNRIDIDSVNNEVDYYCPICDSKLIAKTKGKIRVPHFAHENGSECDSWHYDMSEWHREWQKCFPVDNREVVVENNGTKHRADVLINNTVVEFQHSKISREEFNTRNIFYKYSGYNVIWLFDLQEYFEDERISVSYDLDYKYFWKWAPHTFDNFWPKKQQDRIKVFFQLSEVDENNYGIEYLVWRSPDNKCFFTEENVAYNDKEFIELILEREHEKLEIKNDLEEETWITGKERVLLDIIKNSSSKVIIVKNTKTNIRFKIGISNLRGRNIYGSVWGYLGIGNGFETNKREIFGADKKEWIVEWEV